MTPNEEDMIVKSKWGQWPNSHFTIQHICFLHGSFMLLFYLWILNIEYRTYLGIPMMFTS
jgi:hypothetical protein